LFFRTVPSANTLVRWVNENAFAPEMRARPCPTFGRPVHLRGSPHRLRPDTSPHALRIPSRDGHPALRSTAGGGFRSALACVQLSLSCPFRLLHTFHLSGPRGITPAFGYGAPHSSARGTLTLLSNVLLSTHFLGYDFSGITIGTLNTAALVVKDRLVIGIVNSDSTGARNHQSWRRTATGSMRKARQTGA